MHLHTLYNYKNVKAVNGEFLHHPGDSIEKANSFYKENFI